MGKSLSMDFVILSVMLVASGVESVNPAYNGILGKSFYFYESIPDNNTFIVWNFKTTLIARHFPGGSPQCVGEQFAGRCSLFVNGTLRLDNVTPEDDGTYTFSAEWSNGTSIKNAAYDFTVYSPLSAPVLSSNSTNNNRFVSGTYVSLHCDGGGQSITSYTFYRDEKNICSGPNVNCTNSHLYFQPITTSYNGSYSCVIQNPASSNTSNILELIESVRISDVRLTSNASGYLWPGINSSSLTCSALGTEISYTWSLKGAPLPQDSQYQLSRGNSTLIISPVSANDDGPFTCTASNWINNETSSNLTFILAAKVSNVSLTSNTSGESHIWAEEASVNLHCSAEGTEVYFSWKQNGNPVPVGSSHYQITTNDSPPSSNLTISPISKTDAGPFTCEASNLISKETSNNVNFNLRWRPENGIKCLAEASGNDVILMCSWPGGNPAANVSLIFNNQTTTEQNNVTRIVSPSTGNNVQGSNLTCHGDQLGKISQCTLPFEPPKAPGHNDNSVTEGTAGKVVVLTVTLSEGLPCVFNWYRVTPNHEDIPNESAKARASTEKYKVDSNSSSSSLQILNANVNDSGKYECIAQNFIGNQSFFFNVDVRATESLTPSKAKTLDPGAIAGIVIGVLAGIALIGILAFFLVRKK